MIIVKLLHNMQTSIRRNVADQRLRPWPRLYVVGRSSMESGFATTYQESMIRLQDRPEEIC